MRISDWSSDVCSSDLVYEPGGICAIRYAPELLVVTVRVKPCASEITSTVAPANGPPLTDPPRAEAVTFAESWAEVGAVRAALLVRQDDSRHRAFRGGQTRGFCMSLWGGVVRGLYNA